MLVDLPQSICSVRSMSPEGSSVMPASNKQDEADARPTQTSESFCCCTITAAHRKGQLFVNTSSKFTSTPAHHDYPCSLQLPVLKQRPQQLKGLSIWYQACLTCQPMIHGKNSPVTMRLSAGQQVTEDEMQRDLNESSRLLPASARPKLICKSFK